MRGGRWQSREEEQQGGEGGEGNYEGDDGHSEEDERRGRGAVHVGIVRSTPTAENGTGPTDLVNYSLQS